MKTSPKISVLMSVYNSASYLKEAMDSVLNQSFPDFEFIIVNDGSTDKSAEIIQSYKDDRIFLVQNETNKGLIYSLNLGLDLVRGEYIARMDADDVCMPDRLKIQLAFMELSQKVGVLGSDYISFSGSSSKHVSTYAGSDVIKGFLLFSATFCHPSLMIRKSVIDENNFRFSIEAKHVEDYELWTRMSFSTEFESVKIPLLKYRSHSNQVSNTYRELQKKNSDKVRFEYLKKLGFEFTEKQLGIHQLVSSNEKIKSFSVLCEIENWLMDLGTQNKAKKCFEEDSFAVVLSKMWKDTCGNTNLGIKAFFKYRFSVLRKLDKEKTLFETKVFLKCFLRAITDL